MEWFCNRPKSGQTMLSVLVAGACGALIVSAMASSLSQAFSSNRSLDQSAAKRDAVGDLNVLMRDSATCTAMITSNGSQRISNRPNERSSLKFQLGNQVVAEDGHVSQDGLLVMKKVDVEVLASSVGGNVDQSVADVVIDWTKRGGGTQVGGSSLKSTRLKIILNLVPAGPNPPVTREIANCVGVGAFVPGQCAAGMSMTGVDSWGNLVCADLRSQVTIADCPAGQVLIGLNAGVPHCAAVTAPSRTFQSVVLTSAVAVATYTGMDPIVPNAPVETEVVVPADATQVGYYYQCAIGFKGHPGVTETRMQFKDSSGAVIFESFPCSNKNFRSTSSEDVTTGVQQYQLMPIPINAATISVKAEIVSGKWVAKVQIAAYLMK
jgi:hypothetical protein